MLMLKRQTQKCLTSYDRRLLTSCLRYLTPPPRSFVGLTFYAASETCTEMQDLAESQLASWYAPDYPQTLHVQI